MNRFRVNITSELPEEVKCGGQDFDMVDVQKFVPGLNKSNIFGLTF